MNSEEKKNKAETAVKEVEGQQVEKKKKLVRIHLDESAPEGVTLASVGAASAPKN